MAFLDDLGKSFSGMGQSVAKQTKTLANTAQYNTSIADKKRQLTKLYAELGEICYRNYREMLGADEEELLGRIRAQQAELEELEERLREVKGVIKCPACGADVASSAAFCTSCGTRILRENASAEPAGPEPVPEGRTCPSCGAILPSNSRFCTNCGARVEEAGEEPEESLTQQPTGDA